MTPPTQVNHNAIPSHLRFDIPMVSMIHNGNVCARGGEPVPQRTAGPPSGQMPGSLHRRFHGNRPRRAARPVEPCRFDVRYAGRAVRRRPPIGYPEQVGKERSLRVEHGVGERAPFVSPFAALPHLLRCPDCAGILELSGRSLTCPTGHSFDLARAGYANLSRSRRTGDSTEMLRARRRFLEAGYYEPLSNLVNRLVGEHRSGLPYTVLDAGCGEGYYLGRLSASLNGLSSIVSPRTESCAAALPTAAGKVQVGEPGDWSSSPTQDYQAIGLDAAKDAARMAAARYRAAAFLVADIAEHLPIADGRIDTILNIFAPRHASEFFRVLRPAGLLLSVIPAPDHLHELRALLPLLGIEERKEEQVRATLGDRFVLVGAEHLSYIMNLSTQSIGDLVDMTPSARHLDSAIRARLGESASEVYLVTASFLVLSFLRRYTLVGSPAS
jgi:23S rRNA (guanine745-N1)-methyltransferase